MSRKHRLTTPRCLLCRGLLVVQQALHRCDGFFRIAYKSKIPFAEQPFRIEPRGGNQRNPACQRLKHANRRDPRHRTHILLPGNMHRDPRYRIGLRPVEIRQIASVLNIGTLQHPQCICRIAHPVNSKSELSKLLRRPQQELADLRRSFIISPVPDPDDVALDLYIRKWTKDSSVCRFVQSPRALNIESLAVDYPQRLAECKHAIEPVCPE
jgi:hypothetical protein